MLPFTKRPARSESPELINTGDIEVVRSPDAKRQSAFPKPSSDRPRVFARSVSDEEMTTLLPRRGMTFNARPGAPVTPVPMAKRASTNPPRAMLEEPPTRQFVRPSAPPPSISPVAGPPRASSRPAPPSRPNTNLAHARSALRPQPVPVVGDDRKSDPRIDPPATVVTAKNRIVAARPTISWAAALVTMGVFVGLVTAVVARGDADTLIDAAASFVDPSGSRAAASGSDAVAVHTKAAETHTNVVVTADTLLAADSSATSDARTAWEQQSVIPAPPRPAPVAYAAPIHHAHTAARPAPAPVAREERKDKEERVASAKTPPAPRTEKVEKADKPEKPAKGARANDDDMESASAADALAKAQLEASLR